jgi:hypothetical protein
LLRLMWMMLQIFVGLMWLIRCIQMLHLLRDSLLELFKLHGLRRTWKTVWLKEKEQKEWLISLAANLTSWFTAIWEIMWLNSTKRNINCIMFNAIWMMMEWWS